MRLSDLNEFIDAKRVYDRAHFRAFGTYPDTTIYFNSVSELREAATLTDTSIKRITSGDECFGMEFAYRGIRFCFYGSEDAEVANG